MPPRRPTVLAGLLVALAAVAAVTLGSVLPTVSFAITVAYVLYPLRRVLVDRGASRRIAGGVATGVAFLALLGLVVPVGYVLYRRRMTLVELVRWVPETVPVAVGGVEAVVRTAPVVAAMEAGLQRLAIGVARAAPVLALETVVFALLVYDLLYRPRAVREAAFRLVPPRYRDLLGALHERTRATLFAIYVLQAATAVGTFLVAYAVFAGLGYRSALSLAVVSGVLQFVPIVGPSVVVVALAAGDFLAGLPGRAVAVLVVGLVFVGLVPDAVIRSQLADRTARMPASLYFVGFVGGILTLGPVGFIAGPLVVALVAETASLLAGELGGRGGEG